VDDRAPDVIDHLCRELRVKLFGDRGDISRELFERLSLMGIKLMRPPVFIPRRPPAGRPAASLLCPQQEKGA
jgi:hypothetical protein